MVGQEKINLISILRITVISSCLMLTACGSSGDDPSPDDPVTSSTWGEMKWGVGTWEQ